MNVFELFGKIAIDSSGAEKGLNKTMRHAKGAESKLASTFKKIGAAAAAAFSVRAIVDFGKQCTQAYASIAAEESAFAQIMGDYSETAQAKLNAVADQTGVASTRMTGAMTSLTAKFKGLGYGVEDATTLASDGLLIAADAAAFWDMSLDESMSHLNSFINGSYEGGEAIGLFANDTQMAAYAIEQGIVKDAKAWAKLDEATKQATRLDYAKKMMESSGATGQAAKEADAYANVMANLKESWRQFQGVVGKPILEKLVLPAMRKLNEFVPKLTEGVQNGIVWLETGFDKIKGYFTEVFTEDGIKWDALPDAMTKMFKDLRTSASKLVNKFGKQLRSEWGSNVWPAIQGVAAKIGIDLPKWSEIELAVTTWWTDGGFAAKVAELCNWTLGLFGQPQTVKAEDVSTVLTGWWTSTSKLVQDTCTWALGMFKAPGETNEDGKTPVEIITEWWEGISSSIEGVCQIDLSKVNIAGIFTSAQTAYDEFIATCNSFVNDVLKAVSSNKNGEVVLNARLSNLFDAGVKAIEGILSSAATLVSGVVGAITGDEEDAKAIGDVFKDLFGVASEVVIGIKDDTVAIFDWFVNNGQAAGIGIAAVATGLAKFALADPAIAAIIAIGSLIGFLEIDWANFESNYPHLVDLFEDLTGLDFTKVSSSLSDFQSDLNGIIEWFKTNEAYLNYMLTLVGAVAFATGHHVVGTALIGAGVGGLWTEAKAMVDAIEAYENGEGDSPYGENGKVRAGPIEFVDPVVADEALQNEDFSDYSPFVRFFRNVIGIFDGSSEWFNGENTLDEWKSRENSFTLPDSDGTGGANTLPGMMVAYAALVQEAARAGSAAGVAEGMSGVTFEATVNTGNVVLDTGVVAGTIAPQVDLILGGKFGRVSG